MKNKPGSSMGNPEWKCLPQAAMYYLNVRKTGKHHNKSGLETFPQLKSTYELTQQIRQWLDKENTGKYEWQIQKQLIHWYDCAEQIKLPDVENLIRIIGSNEQKIMNYFKTGKTNAKAEAMNSKIQRFITVNYGVRDKDFFLYRLAHYYS